jgi:hypothetical protein
LHDVRQLVSEKPFAGCSLWLVFTFREDDFAAQGEGACVHRSCGIAGTFAGMDSDVAELATEARLKKGSQASSERGASGRHLRFRQAEAGGIPRHSVHWLAVQGFLDFVVAVRAFSLHVHGLAAQLLLFLFLAVCAHSLGTGIGGEKGGTRAPTRPAAQDGVGHAVGFLLEDVAGRPDSQFGL